jgi:cytochrome c553
MKKVLLLSTILGSVAFAGVNYKACVGCHGQNFEKAALGKSKIVKDMSADEVKVALHGYKDGSYGGPMKGLMKGQVTTLSDADIEEIAAKVTSK